MRRYSFLKNEEVYDSMNKLRDAFLAAKDGAEVDKILNGLLTFDERTKIGRRILIAEHLLAGVGIDQICNILSVGKNTIANVSKQLFENPECFKIIEKRRKKVEKEYKTKRYRIVGGSQLVFKKKEYTGFKRKDVKR